MLKTLIGKRAATYDGRIWYCPENNIVEVKE